jgi:hypothetical protein
MRHGTWASGPNSKHRNPRREGWQHEKHCVSDAGVFFLFTGGWNGRCVLDIEMSKFDETRCKRCGRRPRKNCDFQRESFEKYAPFCSHFCREMYQEDADKRGEYFDAREYAYER